MSTLPRTPPHRKPIHSPVARRQGPRDSESLEIFFPPRYPRWLASRARARRLPLFIQGTTSPRAALVTGGRRVKGLASSAVSENGFSQPWSLVLEGDLFSKAETEGRSKHPPPRPPHPLATVCSSDPLNWTHLKAVSRAETLCDCHRRYWTINVAGGRFCASVSVEQKGQTAPLLRTRPGAR
ncbi:hypothetical protein AAFF_G00095650 [Aldrovandia affinis]|uniref:Uncharacterized protein n=1 Tax=Aldrovandia affinis TaxID=143900 RepID=A0AAD7WBL5_9TELE|nr:hypothetical protein AAFF_G00095650 [Aldrovandia affinis]